MSLVSSSLPFYRADNATRTSFPSASITGASLQCAYEMFMRNDDTLLVEEVARMLKPGGKVAILPLYMPRITVRMRRPSTSGRDIRIRLPRSMFGLTATGFPHRASTMPSGWWSGFEAHRAFGNAVSARSAAEQGRFRR